MSKLFVIKGAVNKLDSILVNVTRSRIHLLDKHIYLRRQTMSRKKAHLSKFVSLYFYSQVCIPQTRRVETPCHTSTGTLLTYVRHRHVTFSPTSIVQFRYFLVTHQSDNVLLQEGQPSSTCCGSVFVEKEKRLLICQKKAKEKVIKPDQLALKRNPKLGCVWFRSRSTVKGRWHPHPNRTQQGHTHSHT